MALLKFKKGLFAALPADQTEGSVYITTDTKEMYVDVASDKRIAISKIVVADSIDTNGILTVDSSRILKYSDNLLYYVKGETHLRRCATTTIAEGVTSVTWTKIGDLTELTNALSSLGIRLLTVEKEIYGEGEGEAHTPGLKDNLNDLTGQVGALKLAVGKADDNSGLYGYATNVATTKAASALTDAKAYTDEKVEPVAEQANTNKQAIIDLNTGLETKADKTEVAAKIGEIGDVSVKTYVDNIANKKVNTETYNADKLEINNKIDSKANQADVTSAIGAINAKIGTLGNVMNFVGELELVDNEIVIKLKEGETEYKTPEDGDVGFIGDFEYVYIDGEWVKFGDISAESGRITALEEKVGYETTYKEDENGEQVVDKEGKGLVKDVADLKAADITINNEINDIKTQAALLATKTELKAEEDVRKEADRVEAEARAAADEAEAKARKDADDAEAAARSQADADLRTYIDTVLEWGSFDS